MKLAATGCYRGRCLFKEDLLSILSQDRRVWWGWLHPRLSARVQVSFFPHCGFPCAGSDNSASWKNINCQIGNAEIKGTLSFTAGWDSELLWLSTRSNQKWHNYSCTFLISIPIYCKPGVIRPKMCFSCGQVLKPHCSKPLKIRILDRNCDKPQSLTVLVGEAIIQKI